MLVSISLLSLMFHIIYAAENTCVMTETTGCIHSTSYDLETQFVCGSIQAGNVAPIYDKATQGCCNQGQPYSKDLEFCCANKLYPLGAGQCVRWLRSEEEKYPECYDCSVNPNRALSEYKQALGIQDASEENMDIEEIDNDEEGHNLRRGLATWPTSSPFDTIANGPSPTPCVEMTDKVGCFNTYEYKYVTHYPCYNLLLTWATYGCCDGIPYRHASQTCCFLDGEYVVKNANTWCTCQSYECAPTAAPSKKPTTKKPTSQPTPRPTPEPTLTYYPTNSPTHAPTSIPTITFKPTPFVASKAVDEKEFHAKYIYGGGGIIIIGLAVLMYFQGKATTLIKQRHNVVMEIDEAN
mmetsp:Transcript_23928/g.35127  ORF Transcript_23928/g.35127 Transcript_23928/m.35127 type:complete len:352 (-) Transcript_23928:162-1217(-)